MHIASIKGRIENGRSLHEGVAIHRSLAPVELQVQDLTLSRKFYTDLLGFVPAQGYGYSDRRVALVSPLLAHRYVYVILNRESGPKIADGLLLELETSAELLDRYLLAKLLGAPTSPLVTRGRKISASVRDPDGHRIDLRAHSIQRRLTRTSEDRRATRWARSMSYTNSEGRRSADRSSEPRADSKGTDPLAWFDPICSAGEHRTPPG